MLLPQGIEKHRNLSTSFTRFDHLLRELAENRFSGYMKLNSWEYEGVLVVDTGRMLEAYSSERDIYITGEQAIRRLLLKSRETDGTIEVYGLSSEIALTLGYVLQASIYQDEDALSNYSLAQVFDLLERESVTGYVDIQFSGKRGFGTVFFLEGTSVEAVVMSGTGKVASGEQVFHKFLEIGEMIQPHVRVYSVKTPKSIDDVAFLMPWFHDKYLLFWNDLLKYMSNLFKDQFRKNRFYSEFDRIAKEASDHYPFLHPQEGDLQIIEEKLTLNTIVHHQTFVQGMSIILNKMLQQMASRRFRKLDVAEIAEEVKAIHQRHELAETQLDPERLVTLIFRGIT